MYTPREQEIIQLIWANMPISISEIHAIISTKLSIPSLNRELARLKSSGILYTIGKGPSTQYKVNLKELMTADINADYIFSFDIEKRQLIDKFNIDIFDRFKQLEIFTSLELDFLNQLQAKFETNTKLLTTTQFKKEFERLMIELSWKSSQIEGNTYNLLETEQLLKYNLKSSKHSNEEALMLLNHKLAINYSFENKDLFQDLSIKNILDIHLLLTKNFGIAKSLRKRIVRITGTKYQPPDNEFIIQEALEKLTELVNLKTNIFEKAFLTIILLSYIQPFEDGNKRTCRLSGNAILMSHNYCPLSYRSIEPLEYKKAILIFYELNNISAFKKIFIAQYQFAVENYF